MEGKGGCNFKRDVRKGPAAKMPSEQRAGDEGVEGQPQKGHWSRGHNQHQGPAVGACLVRLGSSKAASVMGARE